MKVLVTGAGSGLGRHLVSALGGEGLTRENAASLLRTLTKTGVETIVHCAATSKRGQTSEPLYRWVEDNLLLTQRLSEVPHRKFIYLSSVSVYPDTPGPHREEDYVPADSSGGGVYGVTKLMSEAIVLETAEEPLVLRPVFLLGRDSRPGNLVRVVTERTPALDLSGESTFNVVLHSQIEAFIKLAMEKNLTGVYNAASNDAITLADAARLAGTEPTFGTGVYKVPAVDNRKIVKECPLFDKTSAQVLKEFLGKS